MPTPSKPTQVKINEGDAHKTGVHKLQAKLDSEPIAERGLPKCPGYLRGRARKQWAVWKRDLENMNLDAMPDAAMLEMACINYQTAAEAYIAIQKQGMVTCVGIFSSKGIEIGTKQVTNPNVEIHNAAAKNLKAFCDLFGLSPVARTKLSIEKKDDGEAELRNLLTKPRTKEAVQ